MQNLHPVVIVLLGDILLQGLGHVASAQLGSIQAKNQLLVALVLLAHILFKNLLHAPTVQEELIKHPLELLLLLLV